MAESVKEEICSASESVRTAPCGASIAERAENFKQTEIHMNSTSHFAVTSVASSLRVIKLPRKRVAWTVAVIAAALVLPACTERITERQCFGDTTVRCRDFAIREQAAKVSEGIERLKDSKDVLVARLGEANYERLLTLAKERLAGIEDSRPNWFLRTFAAEREWNTLPYFFPKEVEFRRLALYADSALRQAQASATQANVQPSSGDALKKCVDAKVDAYRKEVGQVQAISADMLDEWKGQCGGK